MQQVARWRAGRTGVNMLRVNIIGVGKVGQTLLSLIADRPDMAVLDVLSGRRTTARGTVKDFGAGRAVGTLDQMRTADLWVLSVPDDQVAGVAAELARARSGQNDNAPVAMHCSGFLASDALAPLRPLGWQVASCHPVLSFADPDIAARQFPGTCCAIEGDAPAAAMVSDVITKWQGVPFPVSPDHKPLYHAAAVFSNNFTTVLQGLAMRAWQDAGVPDDIAARLCAGLLSGTAESVARLGPAAALTGPAARGDTEVLRQQEAAVAAWSLEAGALYAAMSQMARRLKDTGSPVPPAP